MTDTVLRPSKPRKPRSAARDLPLVLSDHLLRDIGLDRGPDPECAVAPEAAEPQPREQALSRTRDVLLTALAPAVWGSTYIVTTETLPPDYPVTVAALRALPAGLLLLAVTRCLPPRDWLLRMFALGALNFAVFWVLLFVAAYRLPGGVAATLGAVQAILVIGFARGLLGTPVRMGAVAAAIAGVFGVALLLLGPGARLDSVGVAAGLGGAAAMAVGTVLSRKWRPPVSALTFTAWQLTAGGLILLPLAMIVEPPMPPLTAVNLAGLAWLGLVGAAATYGL